MTTPRSTKIDLSSTQYYHCMARCVRRAYLYGVDNESGRDYRHRKSWIVNRIKYLSNIFAIQICAYAVMSNHYHLVLYVDIEQAKQWTKKEIIERWSNLFPNDAAKLENPFITDEQIDSKIGIWRERLTNISWYMRCINEQIARLSNNEDNCTGRFWEGRFKSQALLDEAGVLAAMVYVDLNPIRAKKAKTLETSEFTSIYERIKDIQIADQINHADKDINKNCELALQAHKLMPFTNQKNQKSDCAKIDFKLKEYLELCDTTGRLIQSDKKGYICENILPILSQLNVSASGWQLMVNHLEKIFSYAVGNPNLLCKFGNLSKQRGHKGIAAANLCYQMAV